MTTIVGREERKADIPCLHMSKVLITVLITVLLDSTYYLKELTGACSHACENNEVERQRHNKQINYVHPGQFFFPRKNEELLWVWVRFRRTLPTELPGQLSWQGFKSSTQHNIKTNLKPLCAMAQCTLVYSCGPYTV